MNTNGVPYRAKRPKSGVGVEWVRGYVNGTHDDPEAELTDAVIRDLSKTIPDEPVRAYRAATMTDAANPPSSGLLSWTTDHNTVREWSELLDTTEPRVIVSTMIEPDRVLVDAGRLPGVGTQSEIIVAYGALLQRIRDVRASMQTVERTRELADRVDEIERTRQPSPIVIPPANVVNEVKTPAVNVTVNHDQLVGAIRDIVGDSGGISLIVAAIAGLAERLDAVVAKLATIQITAPDVNVMVPPAAPPEKRSLTIYHDDGTKSTIVES